MSHAELLKLLLPPAAYDGNAPAIGAELAAEGAALDLAQGSADLIIEESDPRTTAAMLADWERIYGLPEAEIAALGSSQSFAERRAALVAKVTLQGGQTRAFFIALALALGYVVTITEGFPDTTEFDTEHGVDGEEMRFVWTVNAALYALREAASEDDTEMATAVWGNALLEAQINRYKPAHTLALFAYT